MTIGDELRDRLDRVDYLLLDDRDVGSSRHGLATYWFAPSRLRRYPDDEPSDRLRARGVVRYARCGDGTVDLVEHDTADLPDPRDSTRVRRFERTPALGDADTVRLVRTMLDLVPVRDRRATGIVGVNAFRTFGTVVTAPHRDAVDLLAVYVLDRTTHGSRTRLLRDDVDEPVLDVELVPGQQLVVRDAAFRHVTTPPTTPGYRDALVLTVE